MVQITYYECRWCEKWFHGFKLFLCMLYCYNLSVVSASSEKMAFCFYQPMWDQDTQMPPEAWWKHASLFLSSASSSPQQLWSQSLLYTTPSIYLVSAPCLDFLEVPFSTTVIVPLLKVSGPSLSGLWVTSLISSLLTSVALPSHVIMLTYSHMQSACALAVIMHDRKGPAITVSCSYGNAYGGGQPYVICEHVHLYIC